MRKWFLATMLAGLIGIAPAWAVSPQNVVPGYMSGTFPNQVFTPCPLGNCESGGGVTPVPTNAAGTYSAATVGTSSGSILAANTAKVYLDVINNSPTATVCVNPNGAATISGTVCAAGEWTLPPLATKYFAGNFVPSDQLFAIASAASTPMTVGAK